jgi:DNA-binding transcriptional regulator LsrR (DeoR family)
VRGISCASALSILPSRIPLPAIADKVHVKDTMLADKNIARILDLSRKAEAAMFSVGIFRRKIR